MGIEVTGIQVQLFEGFFENINPVSALRLVRIKSGPGLLPLFARYCSNACTGQT